MPGLPSRAPETEINFCSRSAPAKSTLLGIFRLTIREVARSPMIIL
jgi:hypothetical protein